MKYLLSFAALTLGALAQHELPPQEPSHMQENLRPIERPNQPESEIIIDPMDPMI